MKRIRIRSIVILLLCLLLFVVITLIAFNERAEKADCQSQLDMVRNALNDTASAKLIRYYDNTEIIVTSEIRLLTWFFQTIRLTKCGSEIGEELYGVVFDNDENTINGNEITIVIGTQAMSIDETTYCVPEGVSYDGIIEGFQSLFEHFLDEMKQ